MKFKQHPNFTHINYNFLVLIQDELHILQRSAIRGSEAAFGSLAHLLRPLVALENK